MTHASNLDYSYPMKPSLQARLSQQMALTPQLQQAIKLLLLSQQELNQEIEEYLATNPLLELVEEDNNASSQKPDQTTAVSSSNESIDSNNDSHETVEYSPELEWQEYTSTSLVSDNEFSKDSFDIKDKAGTRLQDYLTWQMNLTSFCEMDRIIAMTIIDSISDEGYLTCSLSDIQMSLGVSEENVSLEEIEAVLHRIQQFDPPGVGARNVQEYLLFQLAHFQDDTPGLEAAKQIIEQFIDLLGKNNTKALREACQLSERKLLDATQLIKSLSPRPSYLYSEGGDSEFIIPDVVVRKLQDHWIVELNNEIMPKIQINPQYILLTQTQKSRTISKELREKYQDAKWFLKSIENRNETLLKVASCIVFHQQEFLEKGDIAMKPLILQDVALKTELHESTISRITTNKYMQTPVGVYELKYFFSSHLLTHTGNECSSTAIRAMIKQLILNESSKKPLSDSKIAALLKEKNGIHIARRTITKYREALGIKASHERKLVLT